MKWSRLSDLYILQLEGTEGGVSYEKRRLYTLGRLVEKSANAVLAPTLTLLAQLKACIENPNSTSRTFSKRGGSIARVCPCSSQPLATNATATPSDGTAASGLCTRRRCNANA